MAENDAAIDALQKHGINFIAIDFDYTLINEHTHGSIDF
jgi:predicted HAD superfamily phosphohydrolase YqeG